MTDRAILYHYPLDPFCRRVRLTLLEKGIPIGLIQEKTWERRPAFLEKNPLGTVPFLVEPDGHTLSGVNAICEYINEIRMVPNLLGETPRGRAEVRRLTEWFDTAFYKDAVYPILLERLVKVIQTKEAPSSYMIRVGRENLTKYLKYVDWLAGRRAYLGGRSLSFADLSAAAHLSVLDYLGELDWGNMQEGATWYAKMKSRPTFAPLLSDCIAGVLPAEHYKDLDF
ncbi:MAG: glutathione S-transferase family protein [Alphaproteobacteria bacterium]|nr:glutathione S-transferase family protein [Alphaproteobacteria bacterium]